MLKMKRDTPLFHGTAIDHMRAFPDTDWSQHLKLSLSDVRIAPATGPLQIPATATDVVVEAEVIDE